MVHLIATVQGSGSGDLSGAAGAGIGIGVMVFTIALTVLLVAACWKIFTKAGEPGWAALIPIYNLVVLLKIAGKPAWWFVLLLIPFVNFVVLIMVMLSLAKNFGKGTGFAFGLLLLSPVFYPMLAWGDARYQPQA
jgi:hypothetical protein